MTSTETMDYMKNVLLAAGSVISDMQNNFPTGCIGKMENGVYKANSIKNVANLSYDVEAPDGFIQDGLLICCDPKNRYVGDPKLSPREQKWHKAIFTLSGAENGFYRVFVKTELDYVTYMTRSLWKIESHEILFKHIESPSKDTHRVIKVPTILNRDKGVYECKDRNYLVENKVAYLLSTRDFEEYDAYLDGKIFDADIKQFVDVDVDSRETVVTAE